LHTVVVLLILAVMAAGGIAHSLRGTIDLVGSGGRVAFYARVLAVELLLLWFVQTGIRRSGYSLRALIDDSSWSAARWLRYIFIGVAGWIGWMVVGAGLGFFLQPSSEELRRVMQILPQSSLERFCWVVFVSGTSLCEEVLYRGYLFRQFRAWTGSAAVALFLQAIVFATGHVILGRALLVSIGLLALWLGFLMLWQKSLVPSMIVHAGTGLVALLATYQ
jgi:membrane protease YdiL (CAAX protease family)